MYTYIYVCVYIYMYVCIYKLRKRKITFSIIISFRTFIRIRPVYILYVYVFVYAYVCMYVCMYVCIYMYVYIYIYIYIYKLRKRKITSSIIISFRTFIRIRHI